MAARFDGKTAIVTGAASGLGRAVAVRLASEGAAVACLDVDKDGVAATAEGLAGGAAYVCDISAEDDVRSTVSAVVDELGPPDVLCNVAGIGQFSHTTEATLDEWNRILRVNLTGMFLMCREVLPHLLERGGNIVNVASTAGIHGQPYSAAYCASKGGVIQLTRALAIEYVSRGVRVNCVAPGGMDTPMLRGFRAPEGTDLREFDRMTSKLGFAKPEDVANAVVFVASEEASFMTGSLTVVDGAITT